MRSRPGRGAIVVLIVCGLLAPGATPLARAQDLPTAADLPVTADPALCQVAPRPIAFFEQYVGTPAAMADATPGGEATAEAASTLDGFVPPTGEPADAATVDAVVATAIEVTACFNAGDILRAFALFSDNVITGFASEDPLAQADLDAMAAAPVPLPADQQESVLAIRDVIVLPDGRAAGFLDFEFVGDYRETQYVVLIEEGGRWLVDEILLFAPLEGTPAP